LLGIPKFSIKENAQGKKRLSVSNDSELWQGLKEAR
jgi:hypothetical protein